MRRHELTSDEWQDLKQLFIRAGPGRPPKVSDRRFLNAVLWKVKTGAPWRDLPARFGNWKTIYSRFRRWAVVGHFKALFEALQIDVDDNWNSVDGSYVRAHQHAAGGKGGPSVRRLAFLEAAIPRSFMLALMRREDLGRSS